MTLEQERESTEYMFTGWTGAPPATGAKVAFLDAAVRPASDGSDWHDGIVVTSAHALWADAQRTGLAGAYYVAILVGPRTGVGALSVAAGDYQRWEQLTDTVEQPVRRCPEAVTIL
jgi:hypothetical protein